MRYAHTNIAAKNWKKISQFYIDVFECTVRPPERKLSGEWLDKATGLSDAQLEGVHLLLPGHGKYGPTLEIFTYAEMDDANPIMANHPGFTHIAFEVESVGETYEKALNHSAEALGEIVEKKVPGIGVLQFVYFRDPEGNIVEIQSWK